MCPTKMAYQDSTSLGYIYIYMCVCVCVCVIYDLLTPTMLALNFQRKPKSETDITSDTVPCGRNLLDHHTHVRSRLHFIRDHALRSRVVRSFARWEDGHRTMIYEGGQTCWNGPKRSLKVDYWDNSCVV